MNNLFYSNYPFKSHKIVKEIFKGRLNIWNLHKIEHVSSNIFHNKDIPIKVNLQEENKI